MSQKPGMLSTYREALFYLAIWAVIGAVPVALIVSGLR